MTIRMTEQEAVSYLTPHHLTGDGACIGLTAGKMREAMDTLHSVTASKIDRISSLEALVRELATNAAGYMEASRVFDAAMKDGGNVHGAVSALYGYESVLESTLSHHLVSELTGEKEGGE